MINSDAGFSALVHAVNGVAVAALASGLIAISGLSTRAFRWVALAALVVIVATTAVSEVTVLSLWAGPVAAGVLFASAVCGHSTSGSRVAAAIAWTAAVAMGSSIGELLESAPEQAWTAHATSAAGPSVSRLFVTLGLAVICAVVVGLSETADAESPVAEVVGRRSRPLIVAVFVPILTSAIRTLATSDMAGDWVWFAYAAAMTVVVAVAALTLPRRGGWLLTAGLAVAASHVATFGAGYGRDSW